MEMLYRCDICKKIIEDKDSKIFAGNDMVCSQHVFCSKCGKPIIDFLKKINLRDKCQN
ncbi:MAG: hypothetical protein ABII25_03015 [bacterium]